MPLMIYFSFLPYSCHSYSPILFAHFCFLSFFDQSSVSSFRVSPYPLFFLLSSKFIFIYLFIFYKSALYLLTLLMYPLIHDFFSQCRLVKWSAQTDTREPLIKTTYIVSVALIGRVKKKPDKGEKIFIVKWVNETGEMKEEIQRLIGGSCRKRQHQRGRKGMVQ